MRQTGYILFTTQIEQYHEDGYFFPDCRPADTVVASIKADHARLVDDQPQFTDYCGDLLMYDFGLLNYAKDPRILDMVGQLIRMASTDQSDRWRPAQYGSHLMTLTAETVVCDFCQVHKKRENWRNII